MILKNFRGKKVQTIIIALIIMMTTTLVTGAASIMIGMRNPIQKLVEECNSPEALIYLYEVDSKGAESVADEFLKLDGVEAVHIMNRYSLTESIYQDEKKLDVMAFITEYTRGVDEYARCIDGNLDFENYAEDECAIPACIANNNDLKVGDVISIDFAFGKRDYTIVGIYTDPRNLSIAFSTNILVKKAPETLKLTPSVFLRLHEKTTPLSVETAYRKAHGGKLPGAFEKLEDRISSQMISINIMGGVLLGIGVCSLLVSILVIFFMVRNTIVSDSKKIAIYKTYGYTYADIVKMYLSYYALVVIAGSFLGVLLSQILSVVTLNSALADIGEKTSPNFIYPGVYCMALIVAVVLFSILSVLKRSKKIRPLYALRGNDSGDTGKSYKGGLSTRFSPLFIALRTISRDKKGAVGIVITSIAIVMLVNLGIVSFGVAKNMVNQNDYWLSIPPSELVVKVNQTDRTLEYVEQISKDSDVVFATPWRIEKLIHFPWKEGNEYTFVYAGVYEDADLAKLTVLEGRNPKTRDEIALGYKMADALNKHIGDYITVSLDGVNEVNLLITGTFQTYYEMGEYARILMSAYSQRDIPCEYDNISVFLKNGTNRDEVMTRLSESLDDGTDVIPREDCNRSIMEMIASPQEVSIPPVCVLILFIGSVSVFSIVLFRNMKNEKINQIYMSIGYTTADLVKSNVWYVSILAVASELIGVPCLLLNYENIMILALSVFGLKEYRVTYSPALLIFSNLAIIVCFIVSAILSSRGLKKLNVRDLVIE